MLIWLLCGGAKRRLVTFDSGFKNYKTLDLLLLEA